MRILCLLAVLTLGACAAQPSSGGVAAADEPTLKLADAAMAGGAPEVALNVANAVLREHPEDVAALVEEGAALAALGRDDQAALGFQRALGLQPASREARIGLGRLELRSDPAEAATLFDEVLRNRPNDVTALIDHGIAEDLQGRHQVAEDSYRAALAAQPDNMAAEVDLALSLAIAGHARRAVGMLQPLAAANGANGGANRRVADDLAVALAISGQTHAASEILAPELSDNQIAAAIAAYRELQPTP
ncbi:MAG TPA: tetratricopeptide repeat protein [Acetobacteraceae bacterium]|nr:tetratricopeptide repeat protein [Acetobacteraceae bacterium]